MRAWPRWSIDAALIVAALVALAVLGGRPSHPGVAVQLRDAAPGLDELRVDVAGAVAHPGVVTVAPGSRVVDAIGLAGGPTAEADTTALNLARRIVDQDHVVVPERTERTSTLLDINVAGAAQLEALPGIGKVTAAAILDSRARDGAYTSTDDLVVRGVITARVYAGLRDLVTTW
jgi:competence protein ComEA